MARLQSLSAEEQTAFEKPPIFNSYQRKQFLRLPAVVKNQISKLEDVPQKIAFALLFGYFKANHKFYALKHFHHQDIQYICEQLELSYSRKHLNLSHQLIGGYKSWIRDFCGVDKWEAKQKALLQQHADLLASKQSHPEYIFKALVAFAQEHSIEVTKYNALNSIVRTALNVNENLFLKTLKSHITPEQTQLFSQLTESLESKEEQKYQKCRFSTLRHIEQSQKANKIKQQVKNTEYLGEVFDGLRPLYEALQLAPKIVEYRASWVRTSRTSQVLQKTKYKRYLDLLCFTAYQFFCNQDALVEKFLNCTQSARNSAESLYQQLVFRHKEKQLEDTIKVAKSSESHIKMRDQLLQIFENEDLSDSEKLSEILTVLRHQKANEPEDILETVESVKKQSVSILKTLRYAAYEQVSRSLQSKVTEILFSLRFNQENCCPKLFSAIQYFREKKGDMGKNAPQEFLKPEEQQVIFDKEGKFKVSLYKIFLFMAVAHGIKASTLSIKDTLQFKSIEEYLIPKSLWIRDKDELLKIAVMTEFKDIDVLLSQVKAQLAQQYKETNQRILSGSNKYIHFKEQGYSLSTPALERTKKGRLQEYFPTRKFIAIQEVLASVDAQTQYLSAFENVAQKYRRQRPDDRLFYAGIMGMGCQIGIPQMAYISSGISLEELESTTTKYFHLDNLKRANNAILQFMSSLDLAELFIRDKGKLHTSSDGQKYDVLGDSLNASYSFKYHGKNKGSTVYNFVDERHFLFHSEVINSSEREAAWVLDGLMQNEVIKSDIHSTDTHGYIEIIFGATHLLGFSFAPRIKSLHKQQLYTFRENSLKSYQDKGYKITPNKYIQEDLIKEHWDEILRFMVTIKLKYATASQLLKRLSSYSKKNPFYRALKNFGQIFKSLFILKYIDNVEMRQAITKQLNKVENIHKFARAVQGRRELLYLTKEEQNISIHCKALIQNSVVCWNYLYLSDILSKMDKNKQIELLELIKESSIVHWQHINFNGMYDFPTETVLENSQFDLPKIRSWKPDPEWAKANDL